MISARHGRNHTCMKSLVVESERLKPLGRLTLRLKYNIKACLMEEQSNSFLLAFASTVILRCVTHDHILFVPRSLMCFEFGLLFEETSDLLTIVEYVTLSYGRMVVTGLICQRVRSSDRLL
jgi:hypothetical protein